MVQTEGKKIDHLTEDEPIPGQKFVCLSFVSPEGIRNCNMRALKIRGVYATYDEAKERCVELQKSDSIHDIFIGEVGKWLPWDSSDSCKDQHYQEEELQKLMDGYKKNLDKSKKMQEERKRNMISQAAKTEQSRLEKRKKRMREKLKQQDVEKKMQEVIEKQQAGGIPELPNKVGGKKLKDTDPEIKSKEESAQKERERLTSNEQQINEQKNTVSSIDEKLAKIQNLYSKLNKKQNEKQQPTEEGA